MAVHSTDHPAMLPPDERVFIRVYRLPERLTQGFCFGGGVQVNFLNVDWFETSVSEGKGPLVEFIKGKIYYKPEFRYLVLGDLPEFTFMIEKEVK